MKHRSFGRDAVTISEVGLGCWQIGGNWSHVDDREATAIVSAALDSGIDFLDTADVYGSGRSESIIGQALRDRGQKDVFVATKVGRLGLYPDKYTEEAVTNCVEASLRRLRTECLDLVQTHCVPFGVMKAGELFGWLGKLQKAGKLKRFGASVETCDEANWLMDNVPGVYSLQVIFNVFRQKPIAEVFDKAKAKGVGIIARVPLASGLLSGRYTKDTTFGKDDHRNFNADGQAFNVGETFGGVPFAEGVELAGEIDSLKPDGMTLAQMALRWILDYDAVSVVIPGATRPEQAQASAAASELPRLSEAIHQKLGTLYRERIHDRVRGAY